jgi:UDPglucose--hexose-1-phosphate uridylyltransferase
MSKLRQNVITGEWVVISPERSQRPEDYVMASSPKRGTPLDCPFCERNNNAYRFSIKAAETRHIYVIPNKFPAFSKADGVIDEGDCFYPNSKALGGHEVIILKNHEKDLYDSVELLDELIGVYRNRYNFFDQDPTIEYSMLIHNHGPEAAASIDHPHSQLFASSVMPSYIEKELEGSRVYYDANAECIFCKMLKIEKENKQRIVYENDEFIVMTFFAARFPFEMWIVPKSHQSQFETISYETQTFLADAMKTAFDKLNKALNFPPFNYWIHTQPHHAGEAADYYHWHVEIAPRVSKFGGYEMGSGIVIDVVSPEVAASFLKKS